MQLVAKTLTGLEKVLSREIKQLLGKENQAVKRAVKFEGELEDIYKLNYQGRCLLRLLAEIESGVIEQSEDKLYDFAAAIDWGQYFGPASTIAVDCVSYSNYFKNANYVALKTKDAIVDRLREETGRRPSVDNKDPDFRIHVFINANDEISVSLDSSGESLHKRGYRREHYVAPINEVLAGGIIQISDWDTREGFYDPMCGSGTFAAEALMLASKIPARYLKPKFAFQKWKNFDQDLWDKIKSEADSQISLPGCEIHAGDQAFKAKEVTKRNLRNLPFGHLVDVRKENFIISSPINGVKKIIINPPYDKRVSHRRLSELYGNIADKLKTNYSNAEAWIITANQDAMKSFELRPAARYSMFNGELDCILYKFELYAGSKKAKFKNYKH